MRITKAARIVVDTSMFVLILFLMSYPLTRGLMRHGICGAVLGGLLVCHHLLNLPWYRALGRGRWNFRRRVLTITAMLLLANTLVLIVSSLTMSGEVFVFMPFSMTSWGRSLHTAVTAWTFVLVSFHMGLHWQGFWKKLRRFLGKAFHPLMLALLAAGGWCLWESRLWSDMLLWGELKYYPYEFWQFCLQYLGITAFFCLLSRLLLKAGERRRVRPRERAGEADRN